MLDHRTLWRTDFTLVPPVARRVARFALQLVSQDPQVHRDPGEPRPPPADTRQDLEIFCTRPPRRVLKRLTTDDGAAPTSGTVALLGETLGLTTTAVRLPRLS